MKLFLAALPLLAAWPLAAADPQPFGSTPLQLDLTPTTNFSIYTFDFPTLAADDHRPIFDRIYLGGANPFPGFNFRDVGPKNENNVPLFGPSLWHLTAEDTTPAIRSDVGLGVRIDLPIGPVRLDFGIPVQHDANGSNGKFQFNGDFPGPGYRDQRARFPSK